MIKYGEYLTPEGTFLFSKFNQKKKKKGGRQTGGR
jgi:hypothetical protein